LQSQDKKAEDMMMSINKKLLLIKLFFIFYLMIIEFSHGGERVNHLNYFGIGARAIGLNHAYTASCNDYTAAFWNPAAMGFFSTTKIGGMINSMSLNRALNYFSLILSSEKYGSFGLSWAGFGVQDVEVRDANTEEPDSYFNSSEKIYFLTYANKVLPYLAVGGNFKLFDFGMLNVKANGIAADLGLFFIPWNKLRFGFVVQDIGSQLTWSSKTTEKFLETYRFGSSFYISEKLLLSCDYQLQNGKKGKLSIGTEFITLKYLQIRCGLQEQKLSIGLGLTLPIKNAYLNFNYALTTDRMDAGYSDVFDFSVVF